MLNTEAKKPVLALVLARLLLGMTLLFVLASGLDAAISVVLRYILPHSKLDFK